MFLAHRGERGFTLIETLAALSVFTIMTIGITPLLISSIRGTALAQSHTVGKNIVSEAMERIRGLPYFDVATGTDVLDLYFPNMGLGYEAGTGTFTTKCTSTTATPAASGAMACPARHSDGSARIPDDLEIAFVARFVVPNSGAPETFTLVKPPTTPAPYNSASEATALPPSQLMEMTITARWTEIGRLRRFSLVSLVGHRKLSESKVKATAKVDHVFSVTTAYKDSTGRGSGLTGTGGSVTADVQIKALASASSDASAGEFVLSTKETATEAGSQIASATGAQARLRAPLNVSPAPRVDALAATISHPGLLGEEVGFIGGTSANVLTPAAGVSVVDGFPKSATNITTDSGVGRLFSADNQADDTAATGKKFDLTRPMFAVMRPTGSHRVLADAFAEATPESPADARRVQSFATAAAPQFVLLPITGASSPGGVIWIETFAARVDCKATGNPATAVATGSWSARLHYWRDSNPGDGFALGSYGVEPPIPLSGKTAPPATATDPLETLRADNPLVLEAVLPGEENIYLFNDPAAGKTGYLESWSQTREMSFSTAESSSVSMPYAINIVTAQTNSTNEESQFNLSIGKLSCRAEDNRA